MPSGKLIRKIQCHEAACTSQPPSVGPTSGPIRPGSVTKLIAARKSVRGTTRKHREPSDRQQHRAADALQHARGDELGEPRATAHASEPSVNSTIAAMNTRRVPSRSASQPDAGISIATVSA